MAQPGSDRDRRPLVERVRAGGDFATRETTKPGAHIARPAELDDTHDEGDVTPVQGVAIRLADRVRQALEAEGYPFSARDQALLDALALEASHRLAEMHAQMHAAGAGIPPRVRDLEAKVAEHEAKHLRLTGANEGNGRLGRIEQRIPATPDERAAEKSTIAAVRWTGLKLAAWLAIVAVAVGGGVWTSIKAQAVVARYEGRRDEHEINQDKRLDRCDPPIAPAPRNPLP